MNECSGVALTCQQCEPFPKRTFTAREDATFVAVIGPSANPRGYTAITGDQKKLGFFDAITGIPPEQNPNQVLNDIHRLLIKL